MAEPQSRNLDVLRALAVASVFFGHLTETWFTKDSNLFVGSVARFGVMAFFVHTSLVLMQSLERMDADGRGKLALRFYVRRLFRIYPLSIVCVMAVLAFGVPYMPWRDVVNTNGRIVASNLLLTMDFTGVRPVLAPLWSLPFEVQMYVALPLCFFLVKKRGINPFLLWICGALLFAPPLTAVRETVKYVPCFLAGVIAYVQIGKVRRVLPAIWLPVSILAVCAVYASGAASLLSRAEGWRYQGLALLVVDWMASLAIGLVLPFFIETSANRAARAAHRIAQYSYGIYLSHVPVMWLAAVVLIAEPWPVRWMVFLLGAVAIPVLAYHLLEEPMVRAGKRLTTPRTRALVAKT